MGEDDIQAGGGRARLLAGARSFFSIRAAIFLGLWFGLLLSGRSGLLRDPGVFWHTVVGREILRTGQFPQTDTFSFTAYGQPWIARQWVGDCLMALLDALSRFDGLLLGTVTLLAGFYTWLISRFLRAGVHWLLAVVLVLAAMAASSYHFHARPHLATIVLLGWTFGQLCDFEAGRIPLRRLCWLVPVFVLWTNTHDGVVGGMATFGLTVAGWGLYKLLGLETRPLTYRSLAALCGLVLACVLTALVNPYGIEVPKVWYALLSSPLLPQIMVEHAPLSLGDPTARAILPFTLIYLAALLGVMPRWPRVTWLVPLVWLALTCSRVRHGPLFATTGAIALAEIFPHVRWAAWLAQRGYTSLAIQPASSDAGRAGWGWRPALIPALLVGTAVVLQALAVPVPVLGRGWARLDRGFVPVELLPELQDYERHHPPGTPIFNEMLFGGFLIYFTPDLRIFIDDRCELYGDEKLAAYAYAQSANPSQVDRWAEHYGFDRALIITGSQFDEYFRSAETWRRVRKTTAATLYEWKGPKKQ